jgi:hypothetical protein
MTLLAPDIVEAFLSGTMLARGYVANELGELDRIAGTFQFFGHDGALGSDGAMVTL